MKINSLLFCFILAIVLGMGSGCAKKPDNAKISSDVQGKFSQDSGLSSKQVAVQANDGVVTLEGTVDNEAQREAAGRQAASISGVRTVINNLRVGDAAVAPTAVAPSASESVPPTPTASAQAVDKPKPSVAKKSSRARGSQGSKTKPDSADDANTNRMSASNQNAADTATQPADAAADHSMTQAPPPPPPAPKKLIIDQGTQLTVRLIDPIDSEKNQTGETFRATLNAPLTSDGEEAVPAGVELTGHLVSVKSAGKFAGQSEVVLQLDSLASGGKTYGLQTDQYKKQGSSRGKNTAEKVGGGAIIGGGKGAAIGSAAGAGVGGGVQAATKGQQIKLPSETVLNFTLQAPITVVQAAPTDATREKLGNSQ